MINITSLKTLVQKTNNYDVKNRAFVQLIKLVPQEDITYLASENNLLKNCSRLSERGNEYWVRDTYYDLIRIKGAGVIPVPILKEELGSEYRKYCKGIRSQYRKEYCDFDELEYCLCKLAEDIPYQQEKPTQKELFHQFYKIFRQFEKEYILPFDELPFVWNWFKEKVCNNHPLPQIASPAMRIKLLKRYEGFL